MKKEVYKSTLTIKGKWGEGGGGGYTQEEKRNQKGKKKKKENQNLAKFKFFSVKDETQKKGDVRTILLLSLQFVGKLGSKVVLSLELLEWSDGSEVVNDILGLAKVDFLLSVTKSYKLIRSMFVTWRTLRILISVSSIILPMFATWGLLSSTATFLFSAFF